MRKAATTKPAHDHCDGVAAASARGAIALPVLAGGPVRKSKTGPWRAAVLIFVHVLMAAHLLQWWITGRTLSPIEPSESMYTLNQGYLNAGFLFFAAAILATLVLGRFVCGWGCHFIAYQDFCAWIMKKIGIKPKPLRARFLVLAPLALALYMFVWPTVYRWFAGVPAPEWENHLITSDFWATFPSVPVAIFSVMVAGFAIVYFLGAKGFCTYACPYGGFFGLVDPVAVGRIRVTDDCEQCGHCTSVCTSNVRVHEEVALYKMVVDPGCMKCMDCISVCPNDALYFGFGKPAAGAKPVRPRKKRVFSFTLKAELAMLVVGLGTFLACRGLYDVFPMLMTMGFAGIAGYVIVSGGRMLFSANEKLQNLQLKKGGRVTPAGGAYLALAALMLMFVLHSGWVKGNAKIGHAILSGAGLTADHAHAAEETWAGLGAEKQAGVDRALGYLERAKGAAPMVKVELYEDLIGVYTIKDRPADAETLARRMVRRHPEYGHGHYLLGSALARQGQRADAISSLSEALAIKPDHHAARQELLAELKAGGRAAEIGGRWLALLKADPENVAFAADLAGELMDAGQNAEAAVAYRHLLSLEPGRDDARLGLRLALVQGGRPDDAVQMYKEEVIRRPDDAGLAVEFAELLTALGRIEEALEQARRAMALDAAAPGARKVLVYSLAGTGRVPEALNAYRRAVQADARNIELAVEFTRFLLDIGAFADAEGQARRVVELAPRGETGLLLLADALLAQSRFADAIEPLRGAIALNLALPEPHFSLAFAHANLRQYLEAEAAVREAIRLKPDDAVYRDLLAQVLRAQGKDASRGP